jgi:hypothetical protein
MEIEGSLPYSQQPATCAVLSQNNPAHNTVSFLEELFSIYPSIYS